MVRTLTRRRIEPDRFADAMEHAVRPTRRGLGGCAPPELRLKWPENAACRTASLTHSALTWTPIPASPRPPNREKYGVDAIVNPNGSHIIDLAPLSVKPTLPGHSVTGQHREHTEFRPRWASKFSINVRPDRTYGLRLNFGPRGARRKRAQFERREAPLSANAPAVPAPTASALPIPKRDQCGIGIQIGTRRHASGSPSTRSNRCCGEYTAPAGRHNALRAWDLHRSSVWSRYGLARNGCRVALVAALHG